MNSARARPSTGERPSARNYLCVSYEAESYGVCVVIQSVLTEGQAGMHCEKFFYHQHYEYFYTPTPTLVFLFPLYSLYVRYVIAGVIG